MAAMVLFGLNAFLDSIFVGQLIGETALAGVALAYPLTNTMMAIGALLGTGAGNVLSIAIGAKDVDTQEKLLGTASIIGLIASVLFTVAAWFGAPFLIKSMGGTGQILTEGVEYFQISILGTVFWVFALMYNMIIRGEGKMMQAAKMMATGLVVNIILNPIFISVLEWGVAGAAWATTIGMIVYSLRGYQYFLSGKASFRVSVNKLHYDGSIASLIVKSGLPGFILSMMGLIQSFVIFNAITTVGDDHDVAFFAASNRVMLFMMTPLFGLMRALQPVLGINFGANQFQRVRSSFKVFTLTGFFIVAPFWVFMNLFPEPTLRLMLPNLVLTATNLVHFRIYLFALPLLPFVFNALTYFPAIGEPKKASLLAVVRQIIFYVPIMLILPLYFGLDGVYWGGTLIDITVTIWMVWMLWKSISKLGK